MALSPEGTKLAALHLSGTLSLWQVPSLRQENIWSINQQVCGLQLGFKEAHKVKEYISKMKTRERLLRSSF